MNIIFMGTPDIAVESLKALVEADYNVIGVVTNPDRPKGRGMKLISSPVKEYASEKGFKIYQPEKIRNNPEFINIVKELNPDVICVVAYGKILPKELLEIPRLGCINVHASLLPKYRGAAPIQWAVKNGDSETGITTMYMDEGMDTGDMILQEKVKIEDEETTGELWQKLSSVGGKLLVKTLQQIEEGTAVRIKQEGEFSIAPMIDKKMSKINWKNQNTKQIVNLVRGLNPIMGAYSYINNKKIKFWKVKKIDEKELIGLDINFKEYKENLEKIQPGTIVYSDSKKGLYIKTKDGIISVIELQGENAKKMNINDFLRGNNLRVGNIFE